MVPLSRSADHLQLVMQQLPHLDHTARHSSQVPSPAQEKSPQTVSFHLELAWLRGRGSVIRGNSQPSPTVAFSSPQSYSRTNLAWKRTGTPATQARLERNRRCRHALHEVSNAYIPLWVECRVVQHSGDYPGAVVGRVGPGRPDNCLQLAPDALRSVVIHGHHAQVARPLICNTHTSPPSSSETVSAAYLTDNLIGSRSSNRETTQWNILFAFHECLRITHRSNICPDGG